MLRFCRRVLIYFVSYALLAVFPVSARAQVSVNVEPSDGSFSSPSLAVVVKFCSEQAPIVSHSIYLNGIDETPSFSYAGSVPGCTYGKRYNGTISLQEGENTLDAYGWDAVDGYGEGSAYYTYTPSTNQPANVSIAYADSYRDVGRCVADCFESVAQYTTPTYRSIDAERGVTLLYRSGRAKPVIVVQYDIQDPSPTPANYYSLKLQRDVGSDVTFIGGSQEIFFAAGTTRLVAAFNATDLETRAYNYTAIVRSHWSGQTLERSVPSRIIVVNDAASEFGAGWRVVGHERAYVHSDGVLIVSGDGSASFFTNCSGACQLGSPTGDFSTLTRQADGTYRRFYRPDSVTYVFASSGLLSYVRSRFPKDTTKFGYSGSLLTSITDPAGYSIVLGYSNGKLSSITTPSQSVGRTSTITVDGNGDLTHAYEPAPDNTLALTANYSQHRLNNRMYAGEGSWSFAYSDADGSLQSTTAPAVPIYNEGTVSPVVTLQSPARVVLDQILTGGGVDPQHTIAAGQDLRAFIQDPRGYHTRFTMTRWGARKTLFPDGFADSVEFSSAGQVTRTISITGRDFRYTWDQSRLTQVYDATLAKTVNISYTITGGPGQGTTDPMDRPWRISSPDGSVPTQEFGYQFWTLYIDSMRVAPRGWSRRHYDDFGRSTYNRDAGGHETLVHTQASGFQNTDSIASPGNRKTRFGKDAYGRVVRVTYPDPASRDSVEYDVLNRVYRTLDALNNATVYGYSGFNLTSATDALNNVHLYTRNALGWMTEERRPGSSLAITYAYDRNGNLRTRTDRRGQTVTMTYDPMNRISSRSTDNASFTWTPGTIWSSNNEGSDAQSFIGGDRLFQWAVTLGVGGTTHTIQYTYHTQYPQLLTQVGTPGADRTFTYDSQDARLQSMSAFGKTLSFSFISTEGTAYTEGFSDLTQFTNGMQRTRKPTSLHRSYEDIYDGAGAPFNFGLGLDQVGRISQRRRNPGDVMRRFMYNSRRQLSWEDRSTQPGTCTPNADYGYDGCSVGTIQESASYSYDAANNLLTGVTQLQIPGNRVLQANGYTFGYDNDGNLISKSGPGLTKTLGWNAMGQLVADTTNGVVTTFGYDAWGRRVRKSVNGSVVERYLWDRDNLFAVYDGSGNVLREYAYEGLDQPVMMRQGGSTVYYVIRDPVSGSVRGLVDADQNTVAADRQFTAYGQLHSGSNSTTNTLWYAGREFEESLGFYYNRGRFYDPSIGRFISEDPIGLSGGFNQYAYAHDDPINNTDPFGLFGEQPSECSIEDSQAKKCAKKFPPMIIRAPREIKGPCPFGSCFGTPISGPRPTSLAMQATFCLAGLVIAAGEGGATADQYSQVRDGWYKGTKTGRWYDLSKQPNGWTGSRNAVVASSRAAGTSAQLIGGVGMVFGAFQAGYSFGNDDYKGTKWAMADLAVSAIGSKLGGWGAGGAAIWFSFRFFQSCG